MPAGIQAGMPPKPREGEFDRRVGHVGAVGEPAERRKARHPAKNAVSIGRERKKAKEDTAHRHGIGGGIGVPAKMPSVATISPTRPAKAALRCPMAGSMMAIAIPARNSGKNRQSAPA